VPVFFLKSKQEYTVRIMANGVKFRNKEVPIRYSGIYCPFRALLSCKSDVCWCCTRCLTCGHITSIVSRSAWEPMNSVCVRTEYGQQGISEYGTCGVLARVNPCGICGTGTGFSSVFPLSVSFHRRSPNSYHLGNA
jgi:hypothetical protein